MKRISFVVPFLAVFVGACSSVQVHNVSNESQIKYATMNGVNYSSNAKKSLINMRGYFDNLEIYTYSEENEGEVDMPSDGYNSRREFYILNSKGAASCTVYSLASNEKLFSSAADDSGSKCLGFIKAKKMQKITLVKQDIDKDTYVLKQEKPEKVGYSLWINVKKSKTTLASTQENVDGIFIIATVGFGMFLTQRVPRITNSDIKIELIDDTSNFITQRKKHDNLKYKPVREYVNFLKSYNNGYYYADTKKEIVERFFDFNLKGSKLGEQEDFSGRGLITSNSGVCQNMEKYLDIRPKFNIAEAEGLNLSVSLRGTLKRYYRPVALSSQEDPINKDTVLSLNPANYYSASQSFDYGCVPTSMKIANVGFSLIAKVAGMFGKNVGDGTIPTELKKTAFVIDILEVN